MKKILTVTISIVFVLGGCKNKQTGTDLPVIDLSKDYPEKLVSFQEMGGELEYIPLETTDEVLLEAIATPVYISDEKIGYASLAMLQPYELYQMFNTFRDTEGIILDLRNYPRNNIS
ncbi:MAG: 6-bladed beta-propeller, partial [Bacteroidales bacterium]|nr:6-bladed beta-propeller [Bacteroidales bacterium]